MPETLEIPWTWTGTLPWFGVTVGIILTVWLTARKGHNIDKPSGILIGAAGFFIPTLLVAALAGLAAAAHPKRIMFKWRVSLAVHTALGFLIAGYAVHRYNATENIPIISLVLLAAVLGSAYRMRRLRIGDKDEARNFNAKQRQEVIKRDGNHCNYCGANGNERGVSLEMDHIAPWSLGGKTVTENAQLLCGPCNRSKGNKSDTEARKRYQKKHGEAAGSFQTRNSKRWM